MCILLAPIKTSVKTETTNKDIQLDQRRYTYNTNQLKGTLFWLCTVWCLSTNYSLDSFQLPPNLKPFDFP